MSKDSHADMVWQASAMVIAAALNWEYEQRRVEEAIWEDPDKEPVDYAQVLRDAIEDYLQAVAEWEAEDVKFDSDF